MIDNQFVVRVRVDPEKLERLDIAERRLSAAYTEVNDALHEVRNAVYAVANGFEGSAVDTDG